MSIIAEIRETGRMHQALLNAEGRLTRQIKAIEKRFNESIGEAGQNNREGREHDAGLSDPIVSGAVGHECLANHDGVANRSTLSGGGGQTSNANQGSIAATSTPSSDAGHIRSDIQQKAACAATHQDAAGQHKGESHIMIADRVDLNEEAGHVVIDNHAAIAGPFTTQGNAGPDGDGHREQSARVATLPGEGGHIHAADQSAVATHSTLSGEQDQAIDAHLKDIVELATLPLAEARKPIRKQQLALRRRLEALAKQLPAWEFVESVHGFGPFGFAMIICEAGDLNNYATHSRLWKRMGMAVIDGKAQRKVTNAEEAERHGYNPRRRSLMHNIGDSLFKKQNAYRDLYLARKEHEQDKLPEGTKMHWHKRALRYMEKRLLRDLQRAWRDATHQVEQAKEAA